MNCAISFEQQRRSLLLKGGQHRGVKSKARKKWTFSIAESEKEKIKNEYKTRLAHSSNLDAKSTISMQSIS